MPTYVAPIEKEFVITEGEGLSKSDPLVVKIKQVSEGGNLRREELLPKVLRRSFNDEQDEIPITSAYKARAVEVYLSMTYCNINYADGEPMFPTKPDGSLAFASFDDFLKAWGKITPDWAYRIHLCALYVNIAWAGDDKDFFLQAYPEMQQILKSTTSAKSKSSSARGTKK